MVPATLQTNDKTLLDFLHAVGDVPLERIRLPIGTATEQEVIDLLDGDDKRICELIDGVLAEKPMGYRESLLSKYIVPLLDEYAEAHDLGLVTRADGPH